VAEGNHPAAAKAGIKVVATERFARTDTSVTPQALKLNAANPDAMLVVASGSGAAMPHKAWSSAATRARSTRRTPPPRPT
jgi:ABC-type branched-subunit amino acid transport system substrate-binding protein